MYFCGGLKVNNEVLQGKVHNLNHTRRRHTNKRELQKTLAKITKYSDESESGGLIWMDLARIKPI